MTKEEIFNFLLDTKNNYYKTESGFKKMFPEEYDELSSYEFPDNFSFLQQLWHYLKGDTELKLGLCKYCKSRSKFIHFTDGYNPFCSRKCANSSESHHEQYRKTCLKKYGVDNASKAECIKHKKSKTCMSHFGVDNPSKDKKIQEQKKETTRKLYGCDYHSQSRHHKDSVHKTWKNKTEEEHKEIIRKREESCIKNFGCKNPLQSEKVKEKIKHTCNVKYGVDNVYQADFVKKKIKETTYKCYGDTVYTRTEFYAKQCRQTFDELKRSFINHGLHIGFGISRIELEFYEYLISKFEKDDIIYNYISELYPFHCDFYIKSLNLYIELNSFWTHGGHPFDENNKTDLEKLELWKLKNNKFYNGAIQTWTIRDVRKRNVAKRNNLNYIEIFESDIKRIISDFESRLSGFTVS